jgi:hypothetical protein
MASFNRLDYEITFAFARSVFYSQHSRQEQRDTAVEIMYMVEDCLGQQIDFPPEARRYRRTRKNVADGG